MTSPRRSTLSVVEPSVAPETEGDAPSPDSVIETELVETTEDFPDDVAEGNVEDTEDEPAELTKAEKTAQVVEALKKLGMGNALMLAIAERDPDQVQTMIGLAYEVQADDRKGKLLPAAEAAYNSIFSIVEDLKAGRVLAETHVASFKAVANDFLALAGGKDKGGIHAAAAAVAGNRAARRSGAETDSDPDSLKKRVYCTLRDNTYKILRANQERTVESIADILSVTGLKSLFAAAAYCGLDTPAWRVALLSGDQQTEYRKMREQRNIDLAAGKHPFAKVPDGFKTPSYDDVTKLWETLPKDAKK